MPHIKVFLAHCKIRLSRRFSYVRSVPDESLRLRGYLVVPLRMIGMPLPASRVPKAKVHKRIVVLHYSPIRDTVVGRKICRLYKKPRDWKHWAHRFAAVYSARCLLHEPKP